MLVAIRTKCAGIEMEQTPAQVKAVKALLAKHGAVYVCDTDKSVEFRCDNPRALQRAIEAVGVAADLCEDN